MNIISHWAIHCPTLTDARRAQFEEQYPSYLPAKFTGIVVHDDKGRWLPGVCMLSSLIQSFDLQCMVIQTLYTRYHLTGPGIILRGEPLPNAMNYAQVQAMAMLRMGGGFASKIVPPSEKYKHLKGLGHPINPNKKKS